MRVRLGEVEVGNDVVGAGPALLLLHAYPYDRRMWQETAARLSTGRRVITMDARGFGESTLPGPYSLEELADDAVGLRDRPDRTSELADIRCPTLVMVGSDDAVTPPAEARALAQAIAGAQLVELASAGHLANLDQPAAFDAALTAFLDDGVL